MIRSVSKMDKWVITRIRELEQTQLMTGFVKKWNSQHHINQQFISIPEVIWIYFSLLLKVFNLNTANFYNLSIFLT